LQHNQPLLWTGPRRVENGKRGTEKVSATGFRFFGKTQIGCIIRVVGEEISGNGEDRCLTFVFPRQEQLPMNPVEVNRISLVRLVAASLILGITCISRGAPPPASSPTTTASDAVNQGDAQREPQIRDAEKRLDEATAAWQRGEPRRELLQDVIHRMAKDNPTAEADFEQLKRKYRLVLESDYVGLPSTAAPLRDLIISDPWLLRSRLADLVKIDPSLANVDLNTDAGRSAVWPAYKKWLVDHRVELGKQYYELAKRTGFPQNIIGNARVDASIGLQIEIFKAFLVVEDPQLALKKYHIQLLIQPLPPHLARLHATTQPDPSSQTK